MRMRNGHENDNVRSLLPSMHHSAENGSGTYFVDASMKLGT